MAHVLLYLYVDNRVIEFVSYAMAKKQDKITHTTPPGLPDDGDLFESPPDVGLDAPDLFTLPFEPAGGLSGVQDEEDFLSAYTAPAKTGKSKTLHHLQTLLISAIVCVGVGLLYMIFLMPAPEPVMSEEIQPQPKSHNVSTPVASQGMQVADVSTTGSDSLPFPELASTNGVEEAVSLGLAEGFYQQLDFKDAYRVYFRLHQMLPLVDHNQALKDFLMFRMALCQKGLGQVDQADALLEAVSDTDYPMLKAMVRYHQSLGALHARRFKTVFQRANQALSLIGAVAGQEAWRTEFKKACHFLANQSVTLQSLMYYDADQRLPADLFERAALTDPFLGLGDKEFSALLQAGHEAYEEAVPAPRVTLVDETAMSLRWQVVCNGAQIQELLRRFAANAELDWPDDPGGQEVSNEGVLARAVHLFLARDTTPEVVMEAAGCVGLYGRLEQERVLYLDDPDRLKSLQEKANFLGRESISRWRWFLLAYDDPAILPNVHFILATLYQATAQTSEALSEYKLIVNRYQRSDLAPRALLSSSMLKTDLKNYTGARDDLKLLVEQYPDVEFSGNAQIYLADATFKAGFYDDAMRRYQRVYNLDMSPDSSMSAALGVGRCAYHKGLYPEVIHWLNRYQDAVVRRGGKPANEALLMLGQAYLALDHGLQAAAIFKRLLDAEAEQDVYVDALSGYVQAKAALSDYVGALNMLSAEHPWRFTRTQANTIQLLAAHMYRLAGLPVRAIDVIENRLAFMSEAQQKRQACSELAECYLSTGEAKAARTYFAKALALAENGPAAHETGLRLARVSLQLGQTKEAIQVCQQVLAMEPAPAISNQAYALLSQAFLIQGQIDQAMKMLMNQTRPDDPNDQTSEAANHTLYSKD